MTTEKKFNQLNKQIKEALVASDDLKIATSVSVV